MICLSAILVFAALSALTFIPTVKAWIFWRYYAGDDVADAGISMDGDYIVAVTKWTPTNVFLLDGSGGLKWKKSVSQSVGSVSISGNGSYVVVGTSYKTVLLFDGSGNLLWTKDLTTSSLYDVDISPDGRYIAVGGYDNMTYFYTNTGVQIWNSTFGDWVSSVSISSNGEYTAVGSWDDFVYLFNKEGDLLWSRNATWPVYAVAVSPEGGFTAAGNSYGNVSFFDNSGSLLWNIHLGSVDGVSVSAGGEYIAVASEYNNKITLLDKTGAVLWDWQVDGYVNNVDITHNGRYMVAASSDKHVYFLENLKPSTITCKRSQAQIMLGESITISGSISPPHEGIEVVLNYTKPDKSVMTRTAISGADGSFSDIMTPDVTGMWSVRTWWGGSSEYMGAQNSTRFIVGSIKDIVVMIGKSRTLFEYFESPEPYSYPIMGGVAYDESISCPAEINYTTQKVTFIRELFTITSFNITCAVEAFEGIPEGTYQVEATYDLYTYISLPFGKSYTHLFSYRIKLNVNVVTKYESTVSLMALPNSIRSGENVSISGAISSQGEITISGATAYLTYRKPDGSTFTRELNTLVNGSFRESYRPDMPGSWTVNATWQGDEDHNGAASPTAFFDVFTDLMHTIVMETKAYDVRMLTNSTLRNFEFSQSLMQISFNVEGPSNTGGFCNVTIPKTFLRGEPWIITIDGDPVTDFAKTENTTHTSLHFAYLHKSAHTVVIRGTWVVPEFSSTMTLVLLMAYSLFGAILGRKGVAKKPKI